MIIEQQNGAKTDFYGRRFWASRCLFSLNQSINHCDTSCSFMNFTYCYKIIKSTTLPSCTILFLSRPKERAMRPVYRTLRITITKLNLKMASCVHALDVVTLMSSRFCSSLPQKGNVHKDPFGPEDGAMGRPCAMGRHGITGPICL